jgi:ribonuclease P protein component
MQGGIDEANVSAVKAQAGKQTWVQKEEFNRWRSGRIEEPKTQRKKSPYRLRQKVQTVRAKYSFPRCRRIGSRKHISRLLREGDRAQRSGYLAVYMPNGGDFDRYAVLVGRHHGSSVNRNRIKRELRETFRLCDASHAPFYDILIRPGSAVSSLPPRAEAADSTRHARNTQLRRSTSIEQAGPSCSFAADSFVVILFRNVDTTLFLMLK